MAKYTLQVRDICESYYDKTQHDEFSDIVETVENTYQTVFRTSYRKLYNPSVANIYSVLYPEFASRFFNADGHVDGCIAEKVLRHFWMREISAETLGLWLLWLNKRVLKIAPKYEAWFNELGELYGWNFASYKNAFLNDINKFEGWTKYHTADGDETYTSTNNTTKGHTVDYDKTTTGSDSGTDNSRMATNTYPQSDLNGTNTYKNMTEKSSVSDSNSYSDTVTRDESGSGTGLITASHPMNIFDRYNADYEKITFGASKPNGEMLRRYKNATIDIEEYIIHEFDDLFLNLY